MHVNEHGLMDPESSAELVERYGCRWVLTDGGLTAEVQRWSPQVKDTLVRSEHVVCVQPCLWRPLALITACRVAKGQPVISIDMTKAQVRNPRGLNELKIAAMLAAAGVRPYLIRAGNYFVNEAGEATRPIAQDGGQPVDPGWRRAGPGEWTWSMRRVMFGMERPHVPLHAETSDWRAGIYALSHSGLIQIVRRGRIYDYRWTALAYLTHDAPPARLEPEQLDIEDDAAIAAMSGI